MLVQEQTDRVHPHKTNAKIVGSAIFILCPSVNMLAPAEIERNLSW
jgi:hypothetical protein